MRFGLQKTTLLDFPGRVAATIFLPGCNLRCPYCHNAQLARGELWEENTIDLAEFQQFLDKRKNVLGGVCITGGEPLLHQGISEIVERIKQAGLKVKLDTNGTFPDRLKKIGADYIAVDIKTSPKRYGEMGASEDSVQALNRTIAYLLSGSTEYEFRTTAHPWIVALKEIREIADWIKGAKKYFITGFRPGTVLDPGWVEAPAADETYLQNLVRYAKKQGLNAVLR